MVIHLKTYQKHFSVFPDSKIDFDENIKGIFDKARKYIGLIWKFRNFLPR